MKRNNKILYENIMTAISKEVKRIIREDLAYNVTHKTEWYEKNMSFKKYMDESIRQEIIDDLEFCEKFKKKQLTDKDVDKLLHKALYDYYTGKGKVESENGKVYEIDLNYIYTTFKDDVDKAYKKLTDLKSNFKKYLEDVKKQLVDWYLLWAQKWVKRGNSAKIIDIIDDFRYEKYDKLGSLTGVDKACYNQLLNILKSTPIDSDNSDIDRILKDIEHLGDGLDEKAIARVKDFFNVK